MLHMKMKQRPDCVLAMQAGSIVHLCTKFAGCSILSKIIKRVPKLGN